MKHLQGYNCARDWIRTSTPFRAPPPQSGASTNFATRAFFNVVVYLPIAIGIATPAIFKAVVYLPIPFGSATRALKECKNSGFTPNKKPPKGLFSHGLP